jgi:hypothetical protein
MSEIDSGYSTSHDVLYISDEEYKSERSDNEEKINKHSSNLAQAKMLSMQGAIGKPQNVCTAGENDTEKGKIQRPILTRENATNWYEGEVEPYDPEKERESHVKEWTKRGLWGEPEKNVQEEVITALVAESMTKENARIPRKGKTVTWKLDDKEMEKENEVRSIIDSILPTLEKRHSDCHYPCGISDSDPRLPRMSSSTEEDEKDKYYECEATGYRATEKEWKKIKEHSITWENAYNVLKKEHDEIMHPVMVPEQEMTKIIDCLKTSRTLENIRYEKEKERNEKMEQTYLLLERNIDKLVEQVRKREAMITEKDRIILKVRKERESQSKRIGTLRSIILENEKRIRNLEDELQRKNQQRKGKIRSRKGTAPGEPAVEN